jgi:sec-independent protein translocase protein TatA
MGLDNPLHIAFLLILLLLVFGAKRLPEMGRSLGSGLRGFRESLSGDALHASLTAPQTAAQPAAAAPAQAAAPMQAAPPAPAPAPQPGTPAQPVDASVQAVPVAVAAAPAAPPQAVQATEPITPAA